MELLNKIINVIGIGHREAVKYVLSTIKKKQPDLTAREFENEAKRLAKKINSSKQVFSPIYAKKESKMSSAEHNSNMESAYIDLIALYKQADALGSIQLKQKDLMSDSFNKARAAILKLINDARVFSIRNRNPEFDDIKLVNFNVSRNASSFAPSAFIDPDSRLLKLPQLMKRRNHLTNRESKRTSLSVEIFGGTRGQVGKQFPIEKSVDAKPETFWADIIYSDLPVQTLYQRWGPNASGEMTEFLNGPYAKVNLSYGSAEAINQIKILPFSKAPVKIVEITYRPNLNSKVRYPIPEFTVEESLDWIEYNFETVFASDIQIVLSQENYSNLIVNIPKNVLYATDFMLRLQEAAADQLAEIPRTEDVDFGGNKELYGEAIKDLANTISEKELSFSSTSKIDLAGKTILSIGETLGGFNNNLEKLLQDVTNFTNDLPKDIANQIETINKVEYLIGAREIETNYVVYSPIGYYESERFQPQTTIANVELEVDERHPLFNSPYGQFYKTSTEWEIELSEDRRVPIFPRNLVQGSFLKVSSERLFISNVSFYGYTRFKSYTAWATVRENDSILVANTDYTLVWNSSFNGSLQIQINKDRYDPGKIYTVDYYADPSCKSIDVLSIFSDKGLPIPDSFDGTKKNNSIELTNFPYVNYNIINSDDFEFNPDTNGYQYTSPQDAYTSGTIRIDPYWTDFSGVTLTTITGNITGVGNGTDFTSLNSSYFTAPYGYYLSVSGLPALTFKVNSFLSATQLTLIETPRIYTGMIGNEIPISYFSGNFTGSPASGYLVVPYSLNVNYEASEQVFTNNGMLYKPLDVTVGGKPAVNVTSYQDLEQPAFNVANANDGEYEYIHDGKLLFFNQPISDSIEIKANYRWVTEYVKVNCTLRANKGISPTITPTVNEYRLLLNTTII